MEVVSTQREDLAEGGPWSCLFLPLAMVLVPPGLCKCGVEELERKGVKRNWQHHGAEGEGCYGPSSAEAPQWESFPCQGQEKERCGC